MILLALRADHCRHFFRCPGSLTYYKIKKADSLGFNILDYLFSELYSLVELKTVYCNFKTSFKFALKPFIESFRDGKNWEWEELNTDK